MTPDHVRRLLWDPPEDGADLGAAVSVLGSRLFLNGRFNKLRIALGATAVQGLLGTTEGITRLRGNWKVYRGKVPVMPTFHPAYLLRNPSDKKLVWEDIKKVMVEMEKLMKGSKE